jgi:hypothetical protein
MTKDLGSSSVFVRIAWAGLAVGGLATLASCSRAHEPVADRSGPPPGMTARATAENAPPSSAASAAPPASSAPSLAASTAPPPPAPRCDAAHEPFFFVSPAHPVAGRPLRVLAVTDDAVDATLSFARASTPASASGGDQEPAAQTRDRRGGPPYAWLADVDTPAAGKWRLQLTKSDACGGGSLGAHDVAVYTWAAPVPDAPRAVLWRTRQLWSPGLENLYSAWIGHLFDAPADAQPSWDTLADVLRDRDRNWLFDYLGAKEDEEGVPIKPDCADLPYFLRAYFAFKLGLPFGFSHCSRGENGAPPHCADFASNEDPFPPVDDKPQAVPAWADPDRPPGGPWDDSMKRFGEFLRTTLADAAQSGAGRTPAADEDGDYYPLRLSADTLRPGAIFADPYGHVLVVAGRLAQTPSSAGVLFAVDGQPDGTVGRKRFWRGNFLFAIDPALGSAGFKRFRPVVRDPKTAKLREAPNALIRDLSVTDQYEGGVEGFYDKVEDVLSPSPLDPTRALLETIQAFEEQVKTRVISVENGRKFLASGKGTADMPDGEKIFETTGSWEDFSTPSRDLRILIAIDVAKAVPARVARRPERYAMPAGKSPDAVRTELEARLAEELRARKFAYTRTDGSPWELSLDDLAHRAEALEMAYDPNDCVELRWGAPAGSEEASTCRAHAPDVQVEKMRSYREWFHERRRPPR